MSVKPINGGRVNTRLGELFKGLVMRLGLSETITPVFDALGMLWEQKSHRVTGVNLNVATNTYVTFETVPAGEEWMLQLIRTPGTTGNKSYLQAVIGGNEFLLTLNATGGEVHDYLSGVIMRPGDTLACAGTNNAGDNSVSFYTLYQRIQLNN